MIQARNLFGVALRILGVWFLYQAGFYELFAMMKHNGVAVTSTASPAEDELFAGFYMILAFVLLVLADHIVKLVYGPTTSKPADPDF